MGMGRADQLTKTRDTGTESQIASTYKIKKGDVNKQEIIQIMQKNVKIQENNHW